MMIALSIVHPVHPEIPRSGDERNTSSKVVGDYLVRLPSQVDLAQPPYPFSRLRPG